MYREQNVTQTRILQADVLGEVDWAGLATDAREVLQAYIRVDTTNPPGNEARATDFLRPILEREGLTVQVASTAPGRANLVAKWAATAPIHKSIILLSHSDVVPVERNKWAVEPFTGVIKDGLLWGRGALDMKGQAVLQLFGLLALKRAGVQPTRDVYWVACADEEAGAIYGAEQVLQQFPELREAECVYNEGGAGIDLGGGAVFGIQNAEKGIFWATLIAKGTPGHGSLVARDNSVVRLVRDLARLSHATRPLDAPPESLLFLDALGHSLPGVAGKLVRRRRWPGVLRLVAAADPLLASQLRDHVSLTMLDAGYKVNVVPGEARATFDMRLMPGQTEAQAKAWIMKKLRDPKISIETGQYVAGSRSPTDHPAFIAIRDALQAEYPQAQVSAYLSAGATDSRVFREAGIPSYGVLPFVLSRAMISGLHGHNERIPVESIERGLRVFARTLVNLGVV